MGTPPPAERQNDRQTLLKTLPSRTLLRAVRTSFVLAVFHRQQKRLPNHRKCITCWISGRAKSTSVQEEDDKTENDDWSDEDVSLPLSFVDTRPKTTGSPQTFFPIVLLIQVGHG